MTTHYYRNRCRHQDEPYATWEKVLFVVYGAVLFLLLVIDWDRLIP